MELFVYVKEDYNDQMTRRETVMSRRKLTHGVRHAFQFSANPP
jgi:hypothetical protein